MWRQVLSTDDINKSAERLFPNPPKIDVHDVPYGDVKNDGSVLFERLQNLTRDHGVKTIFGFSSNSEEIQSLLSTGANLINILHV
jgi:hypothetical protein